MGEAYEIEPMGAADTGRCECCGHVSRRVWGAVHQGNVPLAMYFVHWTVGHVFEHGANIDIVLGGWGDGTTAANRYAVRLDNGPSMMVRDSDPAYGKSTLAEHHLKRSDVIGDKLADMVFAMSDAFLVKDKRLAALWDDPGGD